MDSMVCSIEASSLNAGMMRITLKGSPLPIMIDSSSELDFTRDSAVFQQLLPVEKAIGPIASAVARLFAIRKRLRKTIDDLLYFVFSYIGTYGEAKNAFAEVLRRGQIANTE